MATVCGTNQIDSNITGLAVAEEDCLKILPGEGGADAKWRVLEPNSFDSFAAELTSAARSPINASRQKQKGSVVDLDATVGFNTDVTKNNLAWLFQGFAFADAREQATTAPLNGTANVVITAVAASTGYGAAAGLAIFKPGDIILASGFQTPANNGVKIVTAASATAVMAAGLVNEASVPADAKLVAVGSVGADADLSFSFVNGVASLVSAANTAPFAGILPGTWVFIGGDTTASRFANNVGYARVKSRTATSIVFDQTTFNPVTEAGTSKSIHVYIGTVIRNEKDPDLIKRRSYQFRRTLGKDAAGVQSEYMVGSVANMFTLNMQQASLLTADLSYVSLDQETRTGVEGLKPGTTVSLKSEAAYNTSLNLYRSRLVIKNATDPNATPLFGYVSEATLEINNNAEPSKGLGVMGAFDVSVGDFEVTGSITAYFTTVEATRAVRQNADVNWYNIFAAKNAGLIFDIPLVTLGGGSIEVEKDSPITVPIDHSGSESEFGNTLLAEFFDYLPSVAMPK